MHIELAIDPQWEIHPVELKKWRDNREQVLLLDVRRQNEWDYVHLPDSLLIPLDQLAARAGELGPDKHQRIAVLCHHGQRSVIGTAILRKAGFINVHSVAGGIEAWSLIVDPSVRRY